VNHIHAPTEPCCQLSYLAQVANALDCCDVCSARSACVCACVRAFAHRVSCAFRSSGCPEVHSLLQSTPAPTDLETRAAKPCRPCFVAPHTQASAPGVLLSRTLSTPLAGLCPCSSSAPRHHSAATQMPQLHAPQKRALTVRGSARAVVAARLEPPLQLVHGWLRLRTRANPTHPMQTLPCAQPHATTDAAGDGGAPSSRVYVDWTVYKTKGAMTVKFIKPTWSAATSAGGGFVVDR